MPVFYHALLLTWFVGAVTAALTLVCWIAATWAGVFVHPRDQAPPETVFWVGIAASAAVLCILIGGDLGARP